MPSSSRLVGRGSRAQEVARGAPCPWPGPVPILEVDHAARPCVGSYGLAPNVALTITREGAQLFGQVTGQGRFEMFAESETEFFLKVADVQVTFITDPQGQPTALVVKQAGRETRGVRMK
jgi:hypothetical protein